MSGTAEIGIEALTDLAPNMRWSWNRRGDELWAELDPELWALTHNPWAVPQTVAPASRSQRDRLAAMSLRKAKWPENCEHIIRGGRHKIARQVRPSAFRR